jgi:TPR repeat protein
VDPQDYNIAARRRMVEFALHQRRHAQHFFPSPNPARAAAILRRNAYSAQHFYPWSAMTLAKLYLTGRGVPRDEGEALRLVSLCETARPGKFSKPQMIPGDTVACLLLKARMHRSGWGAPPDDAAAGRVERAAEAAYASATGRRLSAAELAPLFR